MANLILKPRYTGLVHVHTVQQQYNTAALLTYFDLFVLSSNPQTDLDLFALDWSSLCVSMHDTSSTSQLRSAWTSALGWRRQTGLREQEWRRTAAILDIVLRHLVFSQGVLIQLCDIENCNVTHDTQLKFGFIYLLWHFDVHICHTSKR